MAKKTKKKTNKIIAKTSGSDKVVMKLCRKMWKWLSEHPDQDKDGYPDFANDAYEVNDCACCTDVRNKTYRAAKDKTLESDVLPNNKDCKLCLLRGYVWRSNCMIEGPYLKWHRANQKQTYTPSISSKFELLSATKKEAATAMVETVDRWFADHT